MNWHCIQVAPQREMTVATNLGEVGCGVYCPTRWISIPRRGHQRKDEPLRRAYALLPGYLFALAAPGRIYPLLEQSDHNARRRGAVSYLRGVISNDGQPIVIPQAIIDKLVRIENDLRFVPAPPIEVTLEIGDRIVVTLARHGPRPGFVSAKPRHGSVKVDFGGERRNVPMSSIRLAA